MIYFKTIDNNILSGYKEIPYTHAHSLFSKIYKNFKYKFLLESKDISPIYGRLSLIGVDPVLKITGKNDRFSIITLNERGKDYVMKLDYQDFRKCDEFKREGLNVHGKIIKEKAVIEESKRSKQKNIAQVIRAVLKKFKVSSKSMLGLYGAFSYDFIRLFEDIPETLPDSDVNDFTLFLYDSFIFFDHLKEKSEIIVFRQTTQEIEKSIKQLLELCEMKENNESQDVQDKQHYSIKDPNFTLTKEDFEEMVRKAKIYFKEGELFEVVFSNQFKSKFEGDPFSLYLKYRDENPSPYLFYFDFYDEQLVGASPEMMVRCENGIVHTRPISGTAKRGKDPIEDHENMVQLLSDQKERAELDMLIDLGRNDLSRVCNPGIKISDYRFVEKYSKVMHTVAHLSGELKDDNSAFDAFVSCINAGTVTGAPKVAAMNTIEKHEKIRRGYYGGNVGYFTFSGDMDFGIIIRSAHIKDGILRFQVGATLLYDSVPEKEYQETINKAQAFLNTLTF